jgi:predicted ATP-grasp superfamily ATP-dependent carboligase
MILLYSAIYSTSALWLFKLPVLALRVMSRRYVTAVTNEVPSWRCLAHRREPVTTVIKMVTKNKCI